MQAEDDSLRRPRDMIGEVKVRNRREVTFEKKNGILYRIFKHSSVNRGETIWQVVVPKPLRGQVMHLAHNSIMGGHMGIRKTMCTDRVLTNFYLPAVREDVTRYCRSCDVRQRTVRKGTVPRAPLLRMPLIDSPFKRVVVDIVGPINPAIDEGH